MYLNLVITIDGANAYRDVEFVIIVLPMNFDPKKNFFDSSKVESVIKLVLNINPNTMMVIKIIIPVGYTKSVRKNSEQRILLALNF